MPTVDEYLAQGWEAFEGALGSHTYTADLEACFNYRFKSRLTYLCAAAPAKVTAGAAHVLEVCASMGEKALEIHGANNTAPINARDFLQASYIVAEEERGNNGDKPTDFC